MKKVILGYAAGFLSSILIFNSISPAYAEDIFKTINVQMDSLKVIINGKSLHLNNILYDNTTYVPLRDIAEQLGKKVIWDGNSNSVIITEEKLPVNADGYEYYYDQYNSVLFKTDDSTSLYNYVTGDSKEEFTTSKIYSKGGKYYLTLNQTLVMLNLVSGHYNTEFNPGSNIGNITKSVLSTYKLKTEKRNFGDNILQIYSETEPTKQYECSFTASYVNKIFLINNESYLCLDDVLDFFGFSDKLTVKLDENTGTIILELH